MAIELTQTITRVGDAQYDVLITQNGETVHEAHYDRSNAVFPAYHALNQALRQYKDETVHVKTTSQPLADEYNAVYENNFATHLSNLMMIVARQNIDLTVEYGE